MAGRRDTLVLIAACSLLAVVLGVALLASVSLAPGRQAYGAVVALLSVETERGSFPGVWAQVGERRVRVVLNRGSGCVVGDRIDLVEHKTLLGRRYAVGLGGCSGA